MITISIIVLVVLLIVGFAFARKGDNPINTPEGRRIARFGNRN